MVNSSNAAKRRGQDPVTSDNLLLSRVTKSDLQSTANGHPAHAVTGGQHSGVEPRAVDCKLSKDKFMCAVNCKWEKLRIAERGGEDWRFVYRPECQFVMSEGNLQIVFPNKGKSGAYRCRKIRR